MSRRRKVAIGVVALLVIVVLAGVLAGGRDNGVEVRVENVSRRDLVARVTATGHIEPKTSIDISAEVPGRIVPCPRPRPARLRRAATTSRLDGTGTESASSRKRRRT
jgi:hypothetical protein